ncbi:hypothetical protein [Rhodovulum steppense]|uniref:Uncharacterized protein n=1 Tax=Rhodovulum steppense TaxID=540251 RepID=A0A4R1YT56_9RHOB|nr:hypothetical protein [Rhodovulum steppense]TCM83443.1 hypothetical protein EV216_11499 [Rhodovulum steppense]
MADVKSMPAHLKMRHGRIRAGFIAKGSSLTAWSASQGLARQNVDKALPGQWTGPKAKQVVERVLAAAGVRE